MKPDPSLLSSCYSNSLKLASQSAIKSIVSLLYTHIDFELSLKTLCLRHFHAFQQEFMATQTGMQLR